MSPQQILRNLSRSENSLSNGKNRGLSWLVGGRPEKSPALNSSAQQTLTAAFNNHSILPGATFSVEICDRQARQAL